MKLLLISLTSFFLTSSVFSKTEIDMEARLALTQNGYETLKTAIAGKYATETVEREDVYFDVHEGQRFVLRALNKSVRLRLMISETEMKWQVQQTLSTIQIGLFSFKETMSDEQQIAYSPEWSEKVQLYFTALDLFDPIVFIHAKELQNHLIIKKLLPASTQLCSMCTVEKNYFPSHTNKKERIKFKVTLDGETLKMQLGKTMYKNQVFYELEAELKNVSNLARTSARLETWAKGQGLRLDDISHESIDQSRDGLFKLNQTKSFYLYSQPILLNFILHSSKRQYQRTLTERFL